MKWLVLTPIDPAHGESVLVNMSRATSVWAEADGLGSEIWFGAQHENEKFKVRETVENIRKFLAAI